MVERRQRTENLKKDKDNAADKRERCSSQLVDVTADAQRLERVERRLEGGNETATSSASF